MRSLPVERVVRDIEVSGGRMFLFMDDNVLAKRAYMMELFKAIKPLQIQWIGQSSITFVRDTELIRAAAESGVPGALLRPRIGLHPDPNPDAQDGERPVA